MHLCKAFGVDHLGQNAMRYMYAFVHQLQCTIMNPMHMHEYMHILGYEVYA